MPGKKKNLSSILQALTVWKEKSRFRFHVPAHTVIPGEYWARYDLTELSGLDHLYAPRGCIAEACQSAAALFGSSETFFLVNGSSAGLTAAVTALCRPGERILMGRNSHRAAAAGLIFSGAAPCFLPVSEVVPGVPLNICFTSVREALQAASETPRAVLVTSPSYWGIAADLDKIGDLAAGVEAALVVDEAHGGHFLFHPSFPRGAALSGADIWVNSAHKTLGALTPGAYLHLGSGARVQRRRLEEALASMQTSSPPYPVLLSLDLARVWLEEQGEEAYGEALERSHWIRRTVDGLKVFKSINRGDMPEGYRLDPLRITIYWSNLALTGFQAYDLLHEKYGLDMELAGPNYFTAIVHPGLPREGAEALISALTDLERDYYSETVVEVPEPYPLPRSVLTPREGVEAFSRLVPLSEASGLISAQLVTPFPPGVPVLYPGEEIPLGFAERLYRDLDRGVHFQDLESGEKIYLAVVAE